MPKLRLASESNKALPISVEQSIPETSNFVTTEQLDNKLGGVVNQIVDKMTPANAFTPEVSGVIKAVTQVQDLRTALKDPTTAGIEEGVSSLISTIVGNSLQNITGGGQQQVQPTPLRNTLAQIAVSNLTGENSPLPQLMDALTNVLGKQKVLEGYDAGMQYIDQQQRQNNLPATVVQFDENSQEDVVAYAQQMGYSDVQYAQAKLIEHKNTLHQEIEEYQRVQSGGQQSVVAEEPVVQQELVAQEPIIQQEPVIQQEQYNQPISEKQYVQVKQEYIEEPIIEEPIIEEPIIEEPIIEEPIIEEPIIEEPIIEESIIEEPVLKANKVIVLHGKPRKLTLAKDKVEPIIDDKDYEVKVDENLNIDVTYNEGNENDEQKKLVEDSKSKEFLDDNVDDILDEIGE